MSLSATARASRNPIRSDGMSRRLRALALRGGQGRGAPEPPNPPGAAICSARAQRRPRGNAPPRGAAQSSSERVGHARVVISAVDSVRREASSIGRRRRLSSALRCSWQNTGWSFCRILVEQVVGAERDSHRHRRHHKRSRDRSRDVVSSSVCVEGRGPRRLGNSDLTGPLSVSVRLTVVLAELPARPR